VYFIGAQTAKFLRVERVTVEGATANIVRLDYMLDPNGHPIDGVSVGWIMMLILITYLVAMETRAGATLGSRVMRICVIDAAASVGPGVPLHKVILRYLFLLIGVIPIFVTQLVYFWLYGLDVDALEHMVASSSFWVLYAVSFLALLGWIIFLTVQIAKKRDPLYDRMAGTAVLRAFH
jgi:hypothetical protein